MNLGDTTIKAGLTGVIAGLASSMAFGQTNQLQSVGQLTLPAYAWIGGAAAAGSWASDAFSDNVLRKIPQNPKYANAESVAVRLGLAGAVNVAALRLLVGLPTNDSMIKAFGVGAGSKAAGEWVHSNIIAMPRSNLVRHK